MNGAALTSDGAAGKAGIKAGDIITKINGTPVPDLQTLSATLATFTVGQHVTVGIQQQDISRDVSVTLGQLPSS